MDQFYLLYLVCLTWIQFDQGSLKYKLNFSARKHKKTHHNLKKFKDNQPVGVKKYTDGSR